MKTIMINKLFKNIYSLKYTTLSIETFSVAFSPLIEILPFEKWSPDNFQKPQYTKENWHHLLQNPINNSTSFYENPTYYLSTH